MLPKSLGAFKKYPKNAKFVKEDHLNEILGKKKMSKPFNTHICVKIDFSY